MNIYYINMEEHSLRRSYMEKQLTAASKFFKVKRVRAIDAERVLKNINQTNYNPHGHNAYVRSLGCYEIAVFESHRSIWKEIRDSGDTGGVVLEDDVIFSSDFFKRLEAIASCLKNHSIIKLDGCYDPNNVFGSEKNFGGITLRRILKQTPSSAAYMISSDFCHYLLKKTADYCCPVDIYLFKPSFGYRAMQLFPAIAVQGNCSNAGNVLPKEIKESQGNLGNIVVDDRQSKKLTRAYNKGQRDICGFILKATHRNKYFGSPPLDQSLGTYIKL